MASTEDRNRVQSSDNGLTTPLTKTLLLVSLVLVLPVVLLAVGGESFQGLIDRWQETPPAAEIVFASVVAILASDVFLPVPSGPVSTLAGSQLGWLLGTLASTAGMTLGGLIAFGLARRWGRPLAERLAAPEQMDELTASCTRHGTWMMLVTRPLPIVAEAALLVIGTLGMDWRTFLPLLVGSNFVLSATYAALGTTASSWGWLPAAICFSMALPLVGTLVWQHFSRREAEP